MLLNVFLAILPIVFWKIALHVKPFWQKLLFGAGWLIFLPNTVYVLTDIIHLAGEASQVSFFYKIALIVLHIILICIGIITFIYSLYPVELLIQKKRKKYRQVLPIFIFLFNFLISFGVVLGRIERVNSWDLIAHPDRVISSSLQVLNSTPLLIFIAAFGLLCNVIYFGLRKQLIRYAK